MLSTTGIRETSEDEAARLRLEQIQAAMMAELGPSRSDNLPLEDGRGRQNRPRSPPMVPLKPRRNGETGGLALRSWQTVEFNDISVEDKSLDPMAGGQLHRQRKMQSDIGGAGNQAHHGFPQTGMQSGGPPRQRNRRTNLGNKTKMDPTVVLDRLRGKPSSRGSPTKGKASSTTPFQGTKVQNHAPTRRHKIPTIDYGINLAEPDEFMAKVDIATSNKVKSSVNVLPSSTIPRKAVTPIQIQSSKPLGITGIQTPALPKPTILEKPVSSSPTSHVPKSSSSSRKPSEPLDVKISRLFGGKWIGLGTGIVKVMTTVQHFSNEVDASHQSMQMHDGRRISFLQIFSEDDECLLQEIISSNFSYAIEATKLTFESIANQNFPSYKLVFAMPYQLNKLSTIIDEEKVKAALLSLQPSPAVDSIKAHVSASTGTIFDGGYPLLINTEDSDDDQTSHHVESAYLQDLSGLTFNQIEALITEDFLDTITEGIEQTKGPFMKAIAARMTRTTGLDQDALLSAQCKVAEELVNEHLDSRFCTWELLFDQRDPKEEAFFIAKISEALVKKALANTALTSTGAGTPSTNLVDIDEPTSETGAEKPNISVQSHPRSMTCSASLLDEDHSFEILDVSDCASLSTLPQTAQKHRNASKSRSTSAADYLQNAASQKSIAGSSSTLKSRYSIEELEQLRPRAKSIKAALPHDWLQPGRRVVAKTTPSPLPSVRNDNLGSESNPQHSSTSNGALTKIDESAPTKETPIEGLSTFVWATPLTETIRDSVVAGAKSKQSKQPQIAPGRAEEASITSPGGPSSDDEHGLASRNEFIARMARLKLKSGESSPVAATQSTHAQGLATSRWASAENESPSRGSASHSKRPTAAIRLNHNSTLLKGATGLASSIYASKPSTTSNNPLKASSQNNLSFLDNASSLPAAQPIPLEQAEAEFTRRILQEREARAIGQKLQAQIRSRMKELSTKQAVSERTADELVNTASSGAESECNTKLNLAHVGGASSTLHPQSPPSIDSENKENVPRQSVNQEKKCRKTTVIYSNENTNEITGDIFKKPAIETDEIVQPSRHRATESTETISSVDSFRTAKVDPSPEKLAYQMNQSKGLQNELNEEAIISISEVKQEKASMENARRSMSERPPIIEANNFTTGEHMFGSGVLLSPAVQPRQFPAGFMETSKTTTPSGAPQSSYLNPLQPNLIVPPIPALHTTGARPRLVAVLVDDEMRPGCKKIVFGPQVVGTLPVFAYDLPQTITQPFAKPPAMPCTGPNPVMTTSENLQHTPVSNSKPVTSFQRLNPTMGTSNFVNPLNNLSVAKHEKERLAEFHRRVQRNLSKKNKGSNSQ